MWNLALCALAINGLISALGALWLEAALSIVASTLGFLTLRIKSLNLFLFGGSLAGLMALKWRDIIHIYMRSQDSACIDAASTSFGGMVALNYAYSSLVILVSLYLIYGCKNKITNT